MNALPAVHDRPTRSQVRQWPDTRLLVYDLHVDVPCTERFLYRTRRPILLVTKSKTAELSRHFSARCIVAGHQNALKCTHRGRTSVNFGSKTFSLNIYVRKFYKMPKFYMTFVQKIRFFPDFFEGWGTCPRLLRV